MSDHPSMRERTNDQLIRDFLALFAKRDASKLRPYFADDIVFQNYGDPEIYGADALTAMWSGVFRNFAEVSFETINQAVDGDVVIAEQVHGLGLAGRNVAPVMNLAVYEIRDGKIVAWRDYSNPIEARRLLGM